MIILVVIRMKVPKTSVDQEGMFEKKLVAMPGIANDMGWWQNSTTGSLEYIDTKVRPMFGWADYHTKHNSDGYEYDVAWDWHGPQFYAPSQCIARLDWNKPKKSSPLIAIIGS